MTELKYDSMVKQLTWLFTDSVTPGLNQNQDVTETQVKE